MPPSLERRSRVGSVRGLRSGTSPSRALRGAMEYVELARAESARGEVVLRERRDPDRGGPAVVELRVNGVFVMDSQETASEQGLATTALAQVDAPRAVLVGGLGLGFTA